MEKSAWDIAAVLATFLAVIVALVPIYLAHFEKLAKARNIRMRIAVKMGMIIPSIHVIANTFPSKDLKPYVVFSVAEIEKKIEEIESILKESQALKPKEQDIISQTVANLEFMLPAMKAGALSPESAKSVISMLQKSIETVETHGILSGKPHQPWA